MKKKQEEDAAKKRNDDIEAQKKALAAAGKADPKKGVKDINDYKIDFDKEFVVEGITQDTIVEANRTVFRTIVKSNAEKATYLKVLYSYGGSFYFKNGQSMTENTYFMQIDAHKKALNK
ncbi:MAG: hypothetical protein IPJ26_14125 [Bacteroidetes bacterium]|nr:hypothetical protein [Bacteroidota bacterium]